MDLDAFRAGVAEGQQGWDSGYDADRLVLNAGRTWRLGPEPEYFAAWHCPAAGCGRLDDWDRIFRSGEADHLEGAFFQVARIDVAGCYSPSSSRRTPGTAPTTSSSSAPGPAGRRSPPSTRSAPAGIPAWR